MITLLYIENIAVIEKAELEFQTGFNVLTGETGTGKSIIIDSINALLGERTSRDIIRAGASEASVTAVFSNLNAQVTDRLAELELPPSEDGQLYISRKLRADGRNICRINSSPVALAVLKEIGGMLVNIHGQHDGQRLLDASFHLQYLDGFAGVSDLLAEYRQTYAKMQRIKTEMNALAIDEAQKRRSIEMLTQQIGEIEQAKLRPGEEDELLSRRNVVQNSSRILDAVSLAYGALYGGEDEPGACARLRDAVASLGGVSEFDDRLFGLQTRLGELSVLAEDCAHDLGDYVSECDITPGELDTLEARLDLIAKLKRRYGSDVNEVLDYLSHAKQELEKIETSDEQYGRLSAQYLELRGQASELAKKLSMARHEAALRLEKEIMEQLSFLNMEKARFKVQLQNIRVDDRIKLMSSGIDNVEFLIAANPGEEPKPLIRTASGGELSRVMLALKNVLTAAENLSTLIFDEIDAGISGVAAQKVGQKLAALSKNVQVLCVTHLAQIASRADHHFLIEKSMDDMTTRTTVRSLDTDGRKRELARIISGDVTETSLKTAEEMLKHG